MEHDFFDMYLEEMRSITPLERDEMVSVLEGTARGDAGARSRLVEGCLGEVLEMVREYGDSELPLSDLVQEANTALMLDRKSTTSEFLHQVFQKSQLDLVPEIELSSNDLLIDLARIGLGIAFVPDFCIPKNDEDLFILDLKEQLPSRQMMVAYNESLPVSQAARQFMDML